MAYLAFSEHDGNQTTTEMGGGPFYHKSSDSLAGKLMIRRPKARHVQTDLQPASGTLDVGISTIHP